jgi:hypothetical protein
MTTIIKGKPEIDIRKIVDDSGNPGYVNRVLIGTATTGLVRIEWVGARYSASLPPNWSQVELTQQIPTYYPLRYQVADAQNLIVKKAIESDFQWLLLIEHDVMIPPDALLRFNRYMHEEKTPVVSGLYYTRSHPSEPLIYRGRGNSYYRDWEHGDKVYVDGVPTGLLLIHVGILREMWNDSSEYLANNQVTRRVFNTPREIWVDPQTGYQSSLGGTSDLEWCTRLIEGDYIRQAQISTQFISTRTEYNSERIHE